MGIFSCLIFLLSISCVVSDENISEYPSLPDDIEVVEEYNKINDVEINETFYKDSSKIGNISVVNDTHEGKLVVYAETKLSEEPDNIEFDIVYGDLVESDNEGLECSRNFHLF